jgi:hypothetical protein
MAPRIPHVFHFVYGLKPQTEPFHLVHYLAIASCLAVNRPARVLVHFHYRPWGEYWDRIAGQVELVRVARPAVRLEYADRHVERYRYAHESDFVRLDALIAHGGVYADVDTVFVNPIPRHLFDEPFVLGREDDIQEPDGTSRRSLCNAVIMAEPGAEFARRWRARMETAFDGSWSRHSTLLPCDLAEAHPALIHVEPPRTFYPFMWTREDLHRLFEGEATVGTDVAIIHLWAHLWWAEARRDFSDFHAGLLTESYVRAAQTPYARVARPFLPPRDERVRSPLRRLRDLTARGMAGLQTAPARGRRMIGKLRTRSGRDGS